MEADSSEPASSHQHNGSEPAIAGIAHLQAAARSLIAATRSLLDVAENLVENPSIFANQANPANQNNADKIPPSADQDEESQ